MRWRSSFMLIAISYQMNACRYGKHLEFCMAHSEEPNQRLFGLWQRLCTHIHLYATHAAASMLSLPFSINITKPSIVTLHAELHARKWTSEFKWTFYFDFTRFLPRFEWRCKWQGKFIWLSCALCKTPMWMGRCCEWTKWTKWGSIMEATTRKVLKHKCFYSFF